ncbi:hypothetical protein QBC40DRAFT_270200 [Triangularia verruculosa]|uniref:Uncharacterized protein n=1 Tax=Triangularia verruculosa TaxID=2587418 RepID=A0AAN6X6G5_9PEZI|nr:hypothetical protein QBC40DRAFT_270200 [Triangularia verruculosa]
MFSQASQSFVLPVRQKARVEDDASRRQNDHKMKKHDDRHRDLLNITMRFRHLPRSVPVSEERLDQLLQTLLGIAFLDVVFLFKLCHAQLGYTGVDLRRRVIEQLARFRSHDARDGNVVLQMYFEVAYLMVAQLGKVDGEGVEAVRKDAERRFLGCEIYNVLTPAQRHSLAWACREWSMEDLDET